MDTTNATGGVFALTSPITNTNSAANVINLSKIGVNTLQLAAGPNTYTGTTVSKGTLQLTGNNSLTGNTVVTLANDATATFDLNGNNTTIGGLTGGGTTGGKVSLGTGNLTVVTPTNSTFAGLVHAPAAGSSQPGIPRVQCGNTNTYWRWLDGRKLNAHQRHARTFAGECGLPGAQLDQHGGRRVTAAMAC